MPSNYEMYLLHNNPIFVYNLKSQTKKGLTLYNITIGIIKLKKHTNANYFSIVKMLEKEMNSPWRGKVNSQLMKNKPNLSSNAIVNFFVAKDHVHKYYV
jgi:hypothetical protein